MDINQIFFTAYLNAFPQKTVWTKNFPAEMKASEKDNDGWIEWKPIEGTLTESDYIKIEKNFNVHFPKSFINWHKSLFFLDGDCSLIRLPASTPTEPLKEIIANLDWFIPEQLIPQKLYPFASEGNDTGPLVFDGREPITDNEFAVRIYDHESGGSPEGLSEVIFSSFTKLLECMTHYLTERKSRKDFEIIPEFFQIDPIGAGKHGINYWLGWTNMLKTNYKEFGK